MNRTFAAGHPSKRTSNRVRQILPNPSAAGPARHLTKVRATPLPSMHLLVPFAALPFALLTTERAARLLWYELVVAAYVVALALAGQTCGASGTTLGMPSCAHWDAVSEAAVEALVALAAAAPVLCRLGPFDGVLARTLVLTVVFWPRLGGRGLPSAGSYQPPPLGVAALCAAAAAAAGLLGETLGAARGSRPFVRGPRGWAAFGAATLLGVCAVGAASLVTRRGWGGAHPLPPSASPSLDRQAAYGALALGSFVACALSARGGRPVPMYRWQLPWEVPGGC